MNKLLHIMQRDASIDDDDLHTVSTNWIKLRNDRQITMYSLGRRLKLVLSDEVRQLTRRAMQTVSNFQLRNIIIPDKVYVFNRLYMRNRVFHSVEVCKLLQLYLQYLN